MCQTSEHIEKKLETFGDDKTPPTQRDQTDQLIPQNSYHCPILRWLKLCLKTSQVRTVIRIKSSNGLLLVRLP